MEDFACVIFNRHTEHEESGIARRGAGPRNPFIHSYHRWARRAPTERGYPQCAEYLRHHEAHDPGQLFQSEWWRHHRELFAES